MNAHEAAALTLTPRGFGWRLAASLILAAMNFAWVVVIGSAWDAFPNFMNRFDGAHPAFVYLLIIAYVYGTAGLWVRLASFAYRNYGRKWPLFLLGSPFALFWPVIGVPFVICGFTHLIYSYPGYCGLEYF